MEIASQAALALVGESGSVTIPWTDFAALGVSEFEFREAIVQRATALGLHTRFYNAGTLQSIRLHGPRLMGMNIQWGPEGTEWAIP